MLPAHAAPQWARIFIAATRHARERAPRGYRRSSHHSIATASADEHHERERGREERRPVVQHAEVGEQPADQEEDEPEHRAREDPEADAAGAALEVRERQREDHHHDDGRRIEDLVPERDLEARRLLAAEHADVVVERVELEPLRARPGRRSAATAAAPCPTPTWAAVDTLVPSGVKSVVATSVSCHWPLPVKLPDSATRTRFSARLASNS